MSDDGPRMIRIGDAARILGLSPEGVRRYDRLLQPERDPASGERRYHRERVVAFADDRAARRADSDKQA